MSTRTHIPFNCINYNFNGREFEPYDVMPYLMREWEDHKKHKRRRDELPKTMEGLRNWVDKWSQYQFWSRCEYEVILTPWPPNKDVARKIDIYDQIKMNLPIVTEIFAKNIKFKETSN